MKEPEISTVKSEPKNRPISNFRMPENPVKGVNICVIGGGFVGLVSAAGFAEFGHSVVCVEHDPQKLEVLLTGKLPFYERDLEELIRVNVERERLSFVGDLAGSIEGQQAIFTTVGTPSLPSGRADLSALEKVAEVLSEKVTDEQVVVLKSTVPVGTGSYFRQLMSQNSGGNGTAEVVNNPEFLREGSAVHDFFNPQRIVIGGESHEAVEKIAHIYRLGMTGQVPIVISNNETAEMIKYASNAFLATKVGFVNELAGLCDHNGVNVLEVARAMGLDPRIGSEFLDPGPGWGGSCFRKDLSEFSGLGESKGYQMVIMKAVLEANKRQHSLVVEKVAGLVGELKDTRVGVLGLSFKAGTSDMRDSPSIPIIEQLLEKGSEVVAYDPKANGEVAHFLPQVRTVESAMEAADNVDCLLILTEWQEFQLLDLKGLVKVMRNPNIVDARNLLSPELARRAGLNYTGMGQV